MKRSPKPLAEPVRSVAVVIPTVNEAAAVGPLLDRLAGDGFDEIIVADGGSRDGTWAEVARRPSVRWVSAARGRGVQLNAGVQATRSDAVLLLHADSLPPPGTPALVRATLGRTGVSAGAFRMRFDRSHPVLALYAWAGRFETALTTFGDQGLFLRRSDWTRIGGAPDWPFLEDVELRRRLRRLGRIVKRREQLTTSARRYLAEGVVRRQLMNLAVLLLFWAGVPPVRLARWYRACSHQRRLQPVR